MSEMKMNNLLMSNFSHFAIKKLYFKRSFNNISGNRGPLFSHINFEQTYFGVFPGRVWHVSICPGVYVRREGGMIQNLPDTKLFTSSYE